MPLLKYFQSVYASAAGKFVLLVIWSALVLLGFHSRAVAPELRYCKVAEGNISGAVYMIWSRGWDGYYDVVRSDVGDAGRTRPMHWLYHSVPFFLTIVRNGDVFYHDPAVPRSGRINGDLQTHTLFLMASVALSLAVLSFMIGRSVHNFWAGLLLPVYAVSSSNLAENFMVNYCDSQEIGQVLFISLYLLCIIKLFRSDTPGGVNEVVGLLFLLLAYGMKETTIVLLPCILVVLLLRVLPIFNPSSAFRRFAVRHAVSHVCVAGIMIWAVLSFRSGGYASHYGTHSSLMANMSRSFYLLTVSGLPVLHCLLVGGLFYVGTVLYELRARRRNMEIMIGQGMLLLFILGLFAGFWILNLPSPFQLLKYYYPVLLFASMALVIVQVLTYKTLWRQGLKPAAVLWLVGSTVFMTEGVKVRRNEISSFYRDNYEIRKTIRAVSQDLADISQDAGSNRSVHIVAGRLAKEEGILPFLRTINRFHRLNIAHNGKAISCINADERNYFLRYPDAGAVDVTLSESLPNMLNVDRVYILGGAAKNVYEEMRLRGYSLEREWSVGNPGTMIGVYTKL